MKKIYQLLTILISFTSFSQTAKEFVNNGKKKDKLENYQGAINDYTKAIKQLPKFSNESAEIYYLRGKAKFQLQDYRGAYTDLTESIQTAPVYAEAYYLSALSRVKLKEIGAISDLHHAIELRPNYPEAHFLIGFLLDVQYKDYQNATIWYTKAIKLRPNYTEAYYMRGKAKINLNQKKSGCYDLSKAGELGDKKASAEIKKYCN